MSLTKVTNSMLDLRDTATNSVSNTAVGYNTMNAVTNGNVSAYNSAAIGTGALASVKTGFGLTAVGYLAMGYSTGCNTNTAVGASALSKSIGDDNTAVGGESMINTTTGQSNTALGFNSLYSNETGNGNLANGYYSQFSLTSGTANVAIGGSSLYSNQTASSNTAIGSGALYSTTGGANIAIGYFAGYHATTSNEFYLDSRDRTTNANEKTQSLLYGVFNTTSAGQQLRINAQLYSGNNSTVSNVDAAPTLASATTITPTTSIVFVSGTAAIQIIAIPYWIDGGGQITLIPTGAFTTVATGNIAIASTAVVGRALIMTYDKATAKWYPIY
jgi:hypothetical protein